MLHDQTLPAGEPGEEWKLAPAAVCVGILIFDVEHREMLDHLHRLHDGLTEGRPAAFLRRVADKLRAVSARHFAHEEDYMRTLGYSDYRQHADDHSVLAAGLDALVSELYAENATAERSFAAVRTFFRKWLLGHVLEHDRSFANFLMQKGIR